MKFDVNLSILFTELPLLERPAAAAKAGFDAVELWWPFDRPCPADREIDALRRSIEDAGVRLVGLNFDAGDMAAGDRGLLSRPDGSARFQANIDVAVGLAGALGCRVLNALYGNGVPELSPDAQHDLALSNLSRAAEAADRIGATVVVEALNSYESPTYPITSSAAAFEVIDRVGAANVAFLADLYHLHRMGEDVLDLIDASAGRFGHVQIADDPGRGRPGTGAMPYDQILERLDASAYRGPVGLEYRPDGPSAESFGWADRWMPDGPASGADARGALDGRNSQGVQEGRGARDTQDTRDAQPSAEQAKSGE
ncbi:hydroxypyruvate isomerase family protein [Streptosporangium sp. 'caverna']|uniref:hydroxypyruvate isomerase family protein n=1 Tax=Streptosporangium sp. 'caverna' TaxID=2202249 RepID=UPI000D7D758F|nr:hydroxypyruvate isomerase [Streptosporangium sp. 'caverna']